MNKDRIILKDIISILNGTIELYYKSSYIGEFTKENLKETEWINDRVCGIETDKEPTLCVYLTDLNRTY